MLESTRPSGAPTSGDGGIEGITGPVPSPSLEGSRRHNTALFEALLGDRHDEHLLYCTLRRHREVLRTAHGVLLVCGGADPVALGRVIAARVPRGVLVSAVSSQACDAPGHAAVVLPCPTYGTWQHALTAAASEAAARGGLVIPRAPVVGLRALRGAYFAALADAELAAAVGAAGPVVTEEELLIPRMLAGLSTADQLLLREPLRPILDLPEAQRSMYVRTLEALHCNGGTQSGAAAALHVHPNTVRYRMDRIEQITGMRLDDPRDRMRLDLAALLVVLRGHPPDRDLTFMHGRWLLPVLVEAFGGYAHAARIAAVLQPVEVGVPRSDELAGVLAGVDCEVGAERDHEVARAQRYHLREHRGPDQGLGVEAVVARGHGVRADGKALAVAAPRLGEAGRRAVATAGVARLEGVISLAADLADLDGSEEAVSTHAGLCSPWTGGCDIGAARTRKQRSRKTGSSGRPARRELRAPPVDSLPRP